MMPGHFRIIAPPFLAMALGTLWGCTQNLHQNEGAVQMAYSSQGTQVASLFLAPATSSPRAISKGEAISVKLISAYICDFREGRRSGDWFSSSNKGAIPCPGGDGNVSILGSSQNTPGEIAILANAGERTATAGLTYNPAVMQRNGRVVYYNEDIRESGQLINALNIPVYGPKTYEGGTFFMDLAVMELDNDENEQGRQLLQELARIGSAAYAPGTPVINLLNSLGGALLSANGDDVEMRYQMEFDPVYTGHTQANAGTAVAVNTSRAPLQEGYYAIVRMERRDTLPAFESIRVTQENHNPYLSDANGVLYKGGSWLLLRVSREDHAQAATQDFATKLSGILDPAGKTDEAQQKDIDAVIKAVESIRKPPAAK